MLRLSAINLVLGGCLVAAAGCGEGPVHPDDPRNFPLNRVTGRVMQANGQPFTSGGLIRFCPVTNSRFVASADLGPDGSFMLATPIYGKGKVDGAPSGDYDVEVIPPKPVDPVNVAINAGKRYKVKPGDNEITVVIPAVGSFQPPPKLPPPDPFKDK